MDRPLEGIRVLEWAIFHAGPGTSAILGDLGAEVVKIEQPRSGDPARQRNRYGHTRVELPGGSNLLFEGANRNKQSVTIDLGTQKGRDLVYRMIPRCDVFLTNIRRKTVEHAGMTYAALAEINPRLVYVSVSCYGPRGPEADAGGFDFQGQARAGIMSAVGVAQSPPLVLHLGMIDQSTSIVSAQATLAALLMRERTGRGQLVETSVLGSALQVAYLNFLYGLWFRKPMPRHDRLHTDPTRNYYQGSDGNWFMITMMSEADWGRFCKSVGRPDLATDPRFATEALRAEEYSGTLIGILDEVLATRTRDEWLALLREHDLFACAVNEVDQLEGDAQIGANYLDELAHPLMGAVRVPGFPARFSAAEAGTRSAAPRFGEHTDAVLRDLAGCDEAEIAQLRADQVI